MGITDTSTYGMYLLMDLRQESPAVTAGRKRAENAIRDQHGRFMPNDVEAFETWKLDPEHGKKAGEANASTCQRDGRGRFTRRTK